MYYLKNSIFWKVFKSSLGTFVASMLWLAFYHTQMPAILVISLFLISLMAYVFAQIWEMEKSSTTMAFIIGSNEHWEYCRVPYKGKLVSGALKRDGINVDTLAICVQPGKMGIVEKHEFMEMNGQILTTKDGYFVLNSNEQGTILSEVKKTG